MCKSGSDFRGLKRTLIESAIEPPALRGQKLSTPRDVDGPAHSGYGWELAPIGLPVMRWGVKVTPEVESLAANGFRGRRKSAPSRVRALRQSLAA